jgi:hypothetical protein
MYAPIGEGAFSDMLDVIRRAGWSCDVSGTGRSAKCQKGDASFKLVRDDDMFRVQILSGPDSLWSTIEGFRSSVSGVGSQDVVHIPDGTMAYYDQALTKPDARLALEANGRDYNIEQASAIAWGIDLTRDGRFPGKANAWVRKSDVTVSGDYETPASMVEGDTGTLWPSSPDAMTSSAPATVNGRPSMGPRAVVGDDSKSKTYGPYTQATAQSFLDKVRKYGMTVSGSNPWSIDANQHGITLKATQDGSGRVTVAVTGRNFYVGLGKIWDKVDPLMPKADVSGDDDEADPAETAWLDANKLPHPPPGEHSSEYQFYLMNKGAKKTTKKLDASTKKLDDKKATVNGRPYMGPKFSTDDDEDDEDEVGDDWQNLSNEMAKLDKALGVELHGEDGRIIGIIGEDWTPPLSTDPKAQVEFLEHVYSRTKEALTTAATLDAEARQRVEYEARMAILKAQKLAKTVNEKLEIVATPEIAQSWKDRAKTVETKLDDAADTLETGAKWYLGAIAGVAVGWWVVVGIGAYLYFKHEKRAA